MEFAPQYNIRLRYVKAAYNPCQVEAIAGAPFMVLGPRSPRPWRHAAEMLARYFRREFHFDFRPYTANESQPADPTIARDRILLFSTPDMVSAVLNAHCFYGAVGVRWVDEPPATPCWSLEWAWFHPYERRQGHLTNAWPFILKMFPNPALAEPLSNAMNAFLRKVGYARPHQHLQPSPASHPH